MRHPNKNQSNDISGRAGLAAFLGGAAIATVAYLAIIDRTDRRAWSDLPCIATRTETYQYVDDRPHKQGGRGYTMTGERDVCIERATIGPVMPRD